MHFKKQNEILNSKLLLVEYYVVANTFLYLGDFETYLANMSDEYNNEQVGKNKPGKKCGVLICDEVKIDGKLIINMQSQQIVGLGSQFDDYADLYDSFAALKSQSQTKAAQFGLQFVWRDATSGFELLGPTWKFVESYQPKHLIACMRRTIAALHRFRFDVLAFICDCARVNLKTVQQLIMGTSGHLGVS